MRVGAVSQQFQRGRERPRLRTLVAFEAVARVLLVLTIEVLVYDEPVVQQMLADYVLLNNKAFNNYSNIE